MQSFHFFFLTDRPTDPPSREGGRWERWGWPKGKRVNGVCAFWRGCLENKDP